MLFHLEVGDQIGKGALLALFGALAIVEVEKGQAVVLRGDGGGHAGVETAADQDYGQRRLSHAAPVPAGWWTSW